MKEDKHSERVHTAEAGVSLKWLGSWGAMKPCKWRYKRSM